MHGGKRKRNGPVEREKNQREGERKAKEKTEREKKKASDDPAREAREHHRQRQ